ncbi:hypothetical protein G9A89_013143 [Geosiphon pyriformis]|nr:hypothetical protein G9A89_013143 [Geosiphon pyriformis]
MRENTQRKETRPSKSLRPIKVEHPFDHIEIDLVESLTITSRDNKYIAVQNTTQTTSFELVYGRTATLPVEIKVNIYPIESITENNFQETLLKRTYDLIKTLKNKWQKAADNIQKSQKKQKKRHNNQLLDKPVEFKIGDKAALDVCRSESSLVCLDFRNCCWIEHCHIATIILKVKGHSGVSGNEHANTLAKGAALSAWHLPHLVSEHFLCTGGIAVSGNSRHFVHDVFWSVHQARWEIGVGSHVVDDSLHADINWSKSSMVWHPDSHLASGFTSMYMAGCRTYFMKALHHWLPVAVRKRLYDRRYPSVVCLFCDDVETSDHVFSCPQNAVSHARLLGAYASAWEALSGLSHSSLCVLQALASCVSEIGVGVALCKGFVFDEWFCKSVLVFKDSKEGARRIVSFVREFCLAFWDDVWLVRARHRAFMEKHGLIPCDGSASASVSGLPMVFSAGVIRLLGVAEAFGVGFGFRKFCPFFSGIGDPVSVHISV